MELYDVAASSQRAGTWAPLGSPRRRQQTAQVVRRYTTGGQSIRAIARDTGMSYGKVHGLLIESGTRLRPRGGARRAPAPGVEAGPS